MQATEEITLVAPCGIHCGDCEAYKAKDNPALMEYLVNRGFKREKYATSNNMVRPSLSESIPKSNKNTSRAKC